MTHTPTPWRIAARRTKDGGSWNILGPAGAAIIARVLPGPAEADAEFIVRAVNSHDELLEALKDLDKVFDFGQRLDPGDFDIEDHAFASAVFVQAHAAIKAASAPSTSPETPDQETDSSPRQG